MKKHLPLAAAASAGVVITLVAALAGCSLLSPDSPDDQTTAMQFAIQSRHIYNGSLHVLNTGIKAGFVDLELAEATRDAQEKVKKEMEAFEEEARKSPDAPAVNVLVYTALKRVLNELADKDQAINARRAIPPPVPEPTPAVTIGIESLASLLALLLLELVKRRKTGDPSTEFTVEHLSQTIVQSGMEEAQRDALIEALRRQSGQ